MVSMLLPPLRKKWAFQLILFIKLSIFSASRSFYAEWVVIPYHENYSS